MRSFVSSSIPFPLILPSARSLLISLLCSIVYFFPPLLLLSLSVGLFLSFDLFLACGLFLSCGFLVSISLYFVQSLHLFYFYLFFYHPFSSLFHCLSAFLFFIAYPPRKFVSVNNSPSSFAPSSFPTSLSSLSTFSSFCVTKRHSYSGLPFRRSFRWIHSFSTFDRSSTNSFESFRRD